MDQEQAKVLFHQGATLVFLDVPTGTEFGVDYNSWNVGPKFKGVKMIPPGVHFIYYSAVNSDHQGAPRTGFFYNFKAKEVLVKKWDKALEDIKPGEVSQEEQERIESNKMELDRFLGAYPYESYKKWVSLTNHMNADLVTSLQPSSGKVCSVAEFKSERSTSQTRKAEAEAKAQSMETDGGKIQTNEQKLPEMEVISGSEIRFTVIPKKKYPPGATPGEMTKYNMDHSYVLKTLLENKYSNNKLELLGELQFAFICFLIGQIYEGFDQWKHLVHLLCSCDEALVTHADFYLQFISVMHYHIKEIPEDFFVDIVSSDNFLTSTLQVFFSNLENSDTVKHLKDRGEQFKKHLQKKFGWDFTSEPDEDAPVVVDL